MKKLFSFFAKVFLCCLILISFCQTSGNAYAVKYKEDWYKLFHVHYAQKPEDCMENIYWLEHAARADFCNPLYTGIKFTDEKQWEKYRYLFMMHINLKLIEQYMRLGRVYDKEAAYFYDAPWKDEYLSDLDLTLKSYNNGLYYWKEAKLWAEKANVKDFNFLYITERQNWEDELERIKTGELNYETIINREIKRVESVRDSFIAMDSKNY